MATPFTPEIEAEWLHAIRDIAPESVMHTDVRRKPAVGAVWLVRVLDIPTATAYANRWHDAGWTPTQWWQLAASSLLVESQLHNGGRSFRMREVTLLERPEQWAIWPELANRIGALRATIAMRDTRNLPLETRVNWATREAVVTRPGIGQPGERITDDA